MNDCSDWIKKTRMVIVRDNAESLDIAGGSLIPVWDYSALDYAYRVACNGRHIPVYYRDMSDIRGATIDDVGILTVTTKSGQIIWLFR